MAKVKLATREAQKLLKLVKINTKPAINLEDLSRKLGIEINYKSFDNEISGCLIRKDNKAIIGVNSKHTPTRQRFTIAHEIGHFQLHQGEPVHVDKIRVNFRDKSSETATNAEEIEANTFAAELLMPTDLINRDIQENELSIDEGIIETLAKRYEVSPLAMTLRLINLGYLPTDWCQSF